MGYLITFNYYSQVFLKVKDSFFLFKWTIINEEELESDVSMKTKYLIINVTCINYTYTFLRRRTNLNRKNDHVSSTTENVLLPVEEQR